MSGFRRTGLTTRALKSLIRTTETGRTASIRGFTMFGWLGDFVSDIGAGTGAALGLTTGLLAGAVVTMQLSGGTPDMQPTTSPVAAVAHAPVPQPPGDQTSPRVVRRLKHQSQTLTANLATAEGTISDLRSQIEHLKSASPTAPPPTAVSEPVPAGSATTNTGTSADAPATSGLQITGVLDSSWILGSELKPWPADCAGVKASYQVRVNSGDHATLAIGSIASSQVKKRTTKGGILSLSCRSTYTATVPTPLEAVYEFVAVSAGTPDKALDTALVPGSKINGGHAPDLYAPFCPQCSS